MYDNGTLNFTPPTPKRPQPADTPPPDPGPNLPVGTQGGDHPGHPNISNHRSDP
uniref:Proline-rich n=1 Tax=Bovine herpesvirus 4 TaxID=10385 RepID=Q65541_BHV4|nr:proline-rich; overlaps with other ORF; no protein identified. Method: conceptual translation supplied by author [Bovine gammaherpesvirus 4]